MRKWYEEAPGTQDVIVSSRVRLERNLKDTIFPAGLKTEERAELVTTLQKGLTPVFGDSFVYHNLSKVSENEREYLREHRILNSALAAKKEPMGLFLSENESMSVLLCGDDHFRMQCILPGLSLHKAWNKADSLDDSINMHYPYAFDSKYGYLTAFPTNVGTGLRATVQLHLPQTSHGKQFRKLVEEIGRIGFSVKGVYADGSENLGALYQVSNQKTLGQSEEDIISSVYRIAGQLAAQERKARQMVLKEDRNRKEDEVYKSYGVLKYARRLTLKEAMTYLSQVRAGVNDGLIQLQEPVSIYRLMLEVQPAAIKRSLGGEAEEEALLVKRADYIREALPELR